jgi:hypothetical protein
MTLLGAWIGWRYKWRGIVAMIAVTACLVAVANHSNEHENTAVSVTSVPGATAACGSFGAPVSAMLIDTSDPGRIYQVTCGDGVPVEVAAG